MVMQMQFFQKRNSSLQAIQDRYEVRFATICNLLLQLAGKEDERLWHQAILELAAFRLELPACHLEVIRNYAEQDEAVRNAVLRLPPLPVQKDCTVEQMTSLFQKIDQRYRTLFEILKRSNRKGKES